MSAEEIAADFGDQVSFVGGLDAQHPLVNGTAEQITELLSSIQVDSDK